MSLPRFYYSPITRGQVEMTGPEAHHMLHVMRMKEGDWVELFDGEGVLGRAVIRQVGSRKALLEVEEVAIRQQRAVGRIIIAASVAKGERFDWLIGKCTELGVDRICPVVFERTVKLAKGGNIVQRYMNLAIAAAKQCERVFLPQIDEPLGLPQSLAKLKEEYPGTEIFFGGLSEKSKPILEEKIDGQKDFIAFIGPEGGLTAEEEALLRQTGGREVRLSDTILRIETAAVSFAAILAAGRLTK
ncbi:MAG: Ribosomal RNA small subunit methyltransferase E [Planctomycetes bacterium ADurb.Bin412]|nr:MAG: Ribosomal RNA small subunit methyltransferase E [Planctomycetes bacterium ADurb.Bin412]